MATNNEEQLEAQEIDQKPRIVITAKSFFIFLEKGADLTLTKEELLAIASLMARLAKTVG